MSNHDFDYDDETRKSEPVDPHEAPTLMSSEQRTGALTRDEVQAAKQAHQQEEREDDTIPIPRPEVASPKRSRSGLLVLGVIAVVVCLVVAVVLGLNGGLALFGATSGDSDGDSDVFMEEEDDSQDVPADPTGQPDPTLTSTLPPVSLEGTCQCQGVAMYCEGELVEDDAVLCQEAAADCACDGVDLVCDGKVAESNAAACQESTGTGEVQCECQGPALYCNGTLVIEESLECVLEFIDCACSGPDFVCDGEVVVENALICEGDGSTTDPDGTDDDGEYCLCVGTAWVCDDITIDLEDERCMDDDDSNDSSGFFDDEGEATATP